MNKLCLIALAALLAGCAATPKYVGMPRDQFDTMRCPATGEVCTGAGGILTLSYQLERLDKTHYRLTGDAVFDLADIGRLKTEITMLFMDDNEVVHEKRIFLHGREPGFTVEFESDRTIKSASPWNFKGVIRS